MIETEASVLSVEAGHAWVAPKPHSPCGQCDPVHGCRSLQLARMFALREPRFRVLDPLGVQPGDKVLIAVPEKSLLHSATLLYLLPVLALMLGAGVASPWGEPAAVAAGVAALFLVFGLVRLFGRRLAGDVRFQPHIARRVDVTVSMEFVRTCRSRS